MANYRVNLTYDQAYRANIEANSALEAVDMLISQVENGETEALIKDVVKSSAVLRNTTTPVEPIVVEE